MSLKKKPNRPLRLLVIAGSDPMAGAGLQADLKTASALGVYALTVVTAVTSQNTKGVCKILNVPKEHLSSQLKSIYDDVEFDGIKIGMIGNKEQAKIIGKFIEKIKKPVVLDPVLVAQSGGELSKEVYVKGLFKYCELITPNASEAERLSRIKIKSLEDMVKAGKSLLSQAKRVLIKGGDTNIGFDVYLEKDKIHTFPIERINTQNTHGTGCSLATAIASMFLNGYDWYDAVSKSREFIRKSILGGVPLGSQFGTIDQFASLKDDARRYFILNALKEAYEILNKEDLGGLVPEIQTNLVYALPYAEKHQDVAGFPGRIIRYGNKLYAPFPPEFGASKHVATLVLSARKFYKEVSSAMALRYIPELIPLLKKEGFSIASFDRNKEPKEIKEKEGSSLDWGVTEALKNTKNMPDIIYDEGGVGKEPIIRIFGKDPFDVVQKVLKIKKVWNEIC
jgi:hydroxymethylpyrimidine/phosphomethylpyrimidine kinase